MQTTLILAFFALLIWVVMTFGIEPALALASVVSGTVWLLYWLIKGKSQDKLPTTVEYARSFFPIFLIVLLLRAFLVEPFRIPSGSMMPTLLVGDFILVNKFTYGLRLPVTKTKLIALGWKGPDALAAALRAADPPVIARIEDDRVVLDPRTVLPEQDRQLLAAIREEAGEVS